MPGDLKEKILNYVYLIPIIFLFVILFSTRQNNSVVLKKLIKKRKTGDIQMYELAKKFIDKECLIYTFNSQPLTGVIKEVNEGALLIENDKALEAVNLDFIVRIREYPRKKNGKKKSVILD